MELASGEKAEMWGPSIVSFGTYTYKYKSDREGAFNFSDSSKMSIGVLSFSLKEMNHLDFYTDLLQPFNLSYRKGSRSFTTYCKLVMDPMYDLDY